MRNASGYVCIDLKTFLMPLSGAFRAVIGHPCQAGLCAWVLWSWLNVDLYTHSFETIKMRSTRCLDLINSLLQTWARAPIILVRTLLSFTEEQSLFLPISYQLLLSVTNREEANQPAAAPAKRLSDSLGGFLLFFIFFRFFWGGAGSLKSSAALPSGEVLSWSWKVVKRVLGP